MIATTESPFLTLVQHLGFPLGPVRGNRDLDRPVDRETVVECIRLASYAPNASNAQEWHWVVVDDPDLLARVGEQYRRCTVPVVTQMLAAKETAGEPAGAD